MTGELRIGSRRRLINSGYSGRGESPPHPIGTSRLGGNWSGGYDSLGKRATIHDCIWRGEDLRSPASSISGGAMRKRELVSLFLAFPVVRAPKSVLKPIETRRSLSLCRDCASWAQLLLRSIEKVSLPLTNSDRPTSMIRRGHRMLYSLTRGVTQSAHLR